MKSIILITTLLMSTLFLSGCAQNFLTSKESPPTVAEDDIPYDGNALQNYYMGREYIAYGRYELAREHYLLALASAQREDLRDSLEYELDAVDKMIQTMR